MTEKEKKLLMKERSGFLHPKKREKFVISVLLTQLDSISFPTRIKLHFLIA